MVVILQRQPLAGVHDNAFDDVAITDIEHMPCAPGALIVVTYLIKTSRFQ
jgi:hypothetical protein